MGPLELGLLIGLAVAIVIVAVETFYVANNILKGKKADRNIAKLINEAETKAEKIVKNAQLDAKQHAHEKKIELDKEIKERRSEVVALENRLDQREENINRRDNILIQKEKNIDQKNSIIDGRMKDIDRKEALLDARNDSILLELEKVGHLTVGEAKEEIFARVEQKVSKEIATYIKNKEDEAKEVATDYARNLISLAINKYAQDEVVERTVSSVHLPSDDMKGRIIGREGRNIRSLEQLLGVDLIIDDTPEVITISSFNPIRREIAKRTLDTLIKDGRIQPGRIEEVVSKVTAELDEVIRKAGNEAVFKLGLPKLNPELITLIGRLKYRSSYGQNAYTHSMEVANLCGIMAAEMGLDVTLAKRAGLLHDLGKAVDYEIEGSHVEIGARLARKFGEPQVVINAIESHHGDVDSKFVISTLVAAADTLSAARPGARSETLATYIKRVEQLESICKEYDGVQQAFAMQSGREIRVIVMPEKVDDIKAFQIAREIREKIENEMTYPGQIKVNVIREYRAIETAK